MRGVRKVAAGVSLAVGLTLSGGPAFASSASSDLRDCLRAAADHDDVAAAVEECLATYLAEFEADDGASVNTGILGSASDGGVNTAILGSADGSGSFNSGILGSAS